MKGSPRDWGRRVGEGEGSNKESFDWSKVSGASGWHQADEQEEQASRVMDREAKLRPGRKEAGGWGGEHTEWLRKRHRQLGRWTSTVAWAQ